IVRRINDQGPVQPQRLLPIGSVVWMVEIRPKLLRGKFVGVTLPWRDGLLSNIPRSIHLIRNDQPVPVDRSCFRELVVHVNTYVVPLPQMQPWSGNLLVVGVSINGYVGKNMPTHDRGIEVEHLDSIFDTRF